MFGNVARGTITTTAILALRTATQAASLLLLAHLLGAESYGRFTAAAALAVVLGIIPNLGAGYVMLAQAPRRGDAISEIWRYAWPLTLVIGIILITAYPLLAKAFVGTLVLPVQILLWIGVTELLLMPLISLLSFALQAEKRVPLSQLIQWFPFGLRALAAIPCFAMPEQDRLISYVILQFLATTLGLIIAVVITTRHVELSWLPKRAAWRDLTEGANYSLMHLVSTNSAELDKILAIRWLSAHETGIYTATLRVVNALVTPVMALLLNAQPRIFHHIHAPDANGVRLIKIVAACASIWGGLSYVILLASSPLLAWLFGSGFASMEDLMPLAAATSLPICLRLSAGTILVALGTPLERIVLELAGIAVLAGCMALLIPRLGIPGLVIALLASEITMALAGWFRIYLRVR
jgi:O-antigen/teichoic acid export membrane protein